MATKKLSELGSKSTLDSTDSFVLSTSSGGRRISKSNFETEMKKNLDLYKVTNLKISNGQWVRIARLSYTSQGLLSITHTFNKGYPVPNLFFIGGYPSDKNYLSLISLMPGSFTKARIVANVTDASETFLEVLFNKAETENIYVAMGCSIGLRLIDATISPNDMGIMKEWDLTTSTATLQANTPLNSIDMQVTENQTSKMGGGITKIPISPDVSLLVKKGGRHNGNENIDRQNQVADTGHFSFRSFDDLCRFIGESEENFFIGNSNVCNERSTDRCEHVVGDGVLSYIEFNPQFTSKRERRMALSPCMGRHFSDTDFFQLWGEYGNIYAKIYSPRMAFLVPSLHDGNIAERKEVVC